MAPWLLLLPWCCGPLLWLGSSPPPLLRSSLRRPALGLGPTLGLHSNCKLTRWCVCVGPRWREPCDARRRGGATTCDAAMEVPHSRTAGYLASS